MLVKVAKKLAIQEIAISLPDHKSLGFVSDAVLN
jgi:hypothetical protein